MKIQLNKFSTEALCEKLKKMVSQQLSDNQKRGIRISEFSQNCIVHICPSCNAILYAMIEDVSLRESETYYSHRSSEFFTQDDKSIIDKFLNGEGRECLDEIYNKVGKNDKLTLCPICASKLNKQIPFALSTESRSTLPGFNDYHNIIKYPQNYWSNERWPAGDDIDAWSYAMLAMIRDNEIPVSKNDADAFAKSCDIFQPNQVPNASVKDSIENLKNYIFNLINLESNIVSLTKRLEQLYYARSQNAKDVKFQRNYPLYDLKSKYDDIKPLFENSQNELKAIEKKKVKPKKVNFPTAPAEPVFKTPNFFNKKRIALENEQLRVEYEKKLERYHEEVKRCKKQEEENLKKAQQEKDVAIAKAKSVVEKRRNEVDSIQKEINEKLKDSDKLPVSAIGVKHLLDSEISITEETMRKLYNCRNQLYSYNVIFDKYRNLVALSSFYEYLMAGRCETLEGASGAYNIYESEIRMDQIISQLDEVIISLEQIKKNQYMIYNKLEEMNTSLHNLESSMEKVTSSLDEIKVNTDSMNKYLDSIEKNTAVIAHNSAVTAYYSKVNAELTNALGFMVALK